jgi:hypothetical protein
MFWQLFLAHLLADFIFQGSYIYKWRQRSWVGSFFHSLIFGITATIVSFSPEIILFFCLLFLTLSHFLIDSLKIYLKNKNFLTPGILFWGDQILHLCLIFTISYLLPSSIKPLLPSSLAIFLSAGVLIFAFIKCRYLIS